MKLKTGDFVKIYQEAELPPYLESLVDTVGIITERRTVTTLSGYPIFIIRWSFKDFLIETSHPSYELELYCPIVEIVEPDSTAKKVLRQIRKYLRYIL